MYIFVFIELLCVDMYVFMYMVFVLVVFVVVWCQGYDILFFIDEQVFEGMNWVVVSNFVDVIFVFDVVFDDECVVIVCVVGMLIVFIGVFDDYQGFICVDFDFEVVGWFVVDCFVDVGYCCIMLFGQIEVVYC